MENTINITGIITAVCLTPCLIFLLFFTAGPVILAVQSRKGEIGKISPTQTLTINSRLPALRTFSHIIEFARQSKLKIDDINESGHQVILNEPLSLFSWGFFYLVSVHQNAEENTSTVEVGIRSKLIQWRVITNRHHESLVKRIRASFPTTESLHE